jgi:hypothetical protein
MPAGKTSEYKSLITSLKVVVFMVSNMCNVENTQKSILTVMGTISE